MATDTEERILIARAVSRDQEAFSELYVTYYDAVLRCVRRVIGNNPEAQDLTSEVFLRAWKAIDHYEDRGTSILTWLCTIAKRLSINYLEKRQDVALEEVEDQANRGEGPEDVAERKWVAQTLRLAIGELPDTQRDVITKRFFQYLTYGEIASSLGKAPGAVRVINHRALRSLWSSISSRDELYFASMRARWRS